MLVFGHTFDIVEKYRQLGMKETESDYGYVSRSMQYELKGMLEFRVGDRSWGGIRIGDGKVRRLENDSCDAWRPDAGCANSDNSN
jgi:hypothetical protein